MFNTMNEVLQRIERIKSVFLDTQLVYAKNDDIDALIIYLENTEIEFRSIAYESASMAIALKDIEHNGKLDTWVLYANGPGLAHKAQVYVGLGWAIAKLNLPFLSVVEKIETRLYFRIADGCGYYDGSFRQRQTVLSQQLPVYIPQAALPMYDQGVGRSFWYTTNDDINKIRSKIENFPAGRQPDLWRGVGIAVAYVGGCDEETLKTLVHYAATNSLQLACGAALAANSRMQANTMTTDTDHCSRLWFMLTAGEANIFFPDPVDTAGIGNEAAYLNWITQIEEGLSNSFEKRN